MEASDREVLNFLNNICSNEETFDEFLVASGRGLVAWGTSYVIKGLEVSTPSTDVWELCVL
jgi:hypothetical protein